MNKLMTAVILMSALVNADRFMQINYYGNGIYGIQEMSAYSILKRMGVTDKDMDMMEAQRKASEAYSARERDYNIKMMNLRNELSPKIKNLEVLIGVDRKAYKDTKEALKGVRESIFNAINEDDTDTKIELEKIEQSYIKLRNEIKKNIDNNKALLKNLKSQYDKTFVPY